MKKTILLLLCTVAVAFCTSGCLVINVEKHEPAGHHEHEDAKEINVDEKVEQAK